MRRKLSEIVLFGGLGCAWVALALFEVPRALLFLYNLLLLGLGGLAYVYLQGHLLQPLRQLNQVLLERIAPKQTPATFPPFPAWAGLNELDNNLDALLEQCRYNRKEAHTLAQVVRYSENSVVVINRRGRIEWLNPRFLQLLGYRFSTAIGQYPARLLRMDATTRARLRDIRAQLRGGQNVHTELRGHSRRGKAYWVKLRIKPLLDAQCQVQSIIVIGVDISASKAVASALHTSEERFRKLIENSSDWIWETDVNFVYTYASPKIQDLLGYPPHNLIGKTPFELMTPRSKKQARHYLQRLIVERKPFECLEYTCLHQDGQEVVLESSGVPIFNRNGDYCGYRGIDRDITLRQRSRELQALNENLARASRLKDEFLANMSHELRTPLHFIISTCASLLEQVYGELNPKQEKNLQAVEASAEHLLTLINDILDLSKIEAGKLDYEPQNCKLRLLCWQSLEFVRQMAEKKQITIHTDFDPALEQIHADERRLKQALINLLTNAVKFTPNGGAIGIRTRALPEEQQFHIAVWDTGIGIPSEARSQLFVPFMQIDSSLSRQYAGTGLGLALVQRLVELHGGEVRLESEEGKGSCFSLVLPWSLTETSPAETTAPLAEQRRRILITDDNEFNAQLISRHLEANGFRCLLAYDGQSACKIARDQPPDLLIMDVHMPGLDGLESVRRVRNLPGLEDIPVIMISAMRLAPKLAEWVNKETELHMHNPLDFVKLVQTVRRLLARHDT